MTEQPHREVAVLNAALELRPAERAAYLDQACAGDAALRKQVEALLQAHDQAQGFLDAPPVGLDFNRTVKVNIPLTEKPGDRIGRYKLLQQIGEGGCGVVYMAEQEEPVRRRVALKVIKLGMDTKQVIARFEAERQALALMDHPNIAKIFDAGVTEVAVVGQASRLPTGRLAPEDRTTGETPPEAGGTPAPLPPATRHPPLVTSPGRPYFVMELVRGIKITDFCDENKLSTADRLKLFIQVCHAIQHAHQKGVIHRDIKPSNILVTINDGVPVPKVIDFGIAKATAGRLTDHTLFTAFEQFIGTPAYMSPEQAVMTSLDVDTRSDIYSLGVLLYELLTSRTPFDQKELLAAGLDEMRRTIREQEPPRPSTCLSTMAADALTTTANERHTDAPKLIHLIRGDLDWLVMKCLEKDRARRYETANALAMDLQRHLNDEPVVACPPSRSYRFQKLVRRNKLAFAAIAAVTTALVLGVVVSSWQAIRATRAEKLATARLAEVSAERDAKEVARQEAEAISTFMGEVFQSPDPARDGRTITVAETLDKAAKKLEADLADQPARRARLQATLGMTYHSLGLYRQAIPLREKVLDYHRAASGPEQPGTLEAMHNLALSYFRAGRLDEALKLQEEVLTGHRKVLGPEDPDTLSAMHNLAISYADAGRRDEALKLREEVLPLRRKVNGPEHPDTLSAMHNLALSYAAAGRHDEALKLREEVLPLRRKVNGPEHPDTLRAMGGLATSYQAAGRQDEALKRREEVLTLHRKVNGPEHPDTLSAMHNLALSYAAAGRLDEALKLREEVLPLRRKVNGPEHPDTLKAMNNLAASYADAGRRDEGLKLREEVLTHKRKVLGPHHPDTLSAMHNLALSYAAAGRRDEALKLREELLALRRKILGHDHPDVASSLAELTLTLVTEKKFADAEPLARECLAIREKKLPDDWLTFSARSLLGGSLLGQKKYAEAGPLLLSAHEGMKQREGEISAASKLDVKESLQRLVQLYEATGQAEKAAEWNKKLAEFDQAPK